MVAPVTAPWIPHDADQIMYYKEDKKGQILEEGINEAGAFSAWLAVATIPLVVFSRFISVSTPILLLSFRQTFTSGAIPVLTWGGLRGGISVALALSLPAMEFKPLLLTCTYAVVLFSIIIQGLTVKSVVNRTVDPTLV